MDDGAFGIGEHLPALSSLTGEGLVREDFVAEMLTLMQEKMGFEHVRYYEAARDVLKDEDILVLVDERPIEEKPHYGFTVPIKESTIALMKTGLYPAIGSAIGPNAINKDWVGDLSLKGRSWVEVPVTEGTKQTGIIACDWFGEATGIDSGDIENLRVVGAQVGSYLGLKPIKALEGYREERDRWIEEEKPPEILIGLAARHLATVTDAAVTAVFELSWPNQRLTKIDEYIAEGDLRERAGAQGTLDESYMVADNLTGQAWVEEKYRHIVDFDSLEQFGHEFVAKESREWHELLLGELHSVVYAKVGVQDQRYLIRLFNRAKRPELPFLTEFAVLGALVSELCSDFDSAIARQRLSSLQKVATETADVSKGPREIVNGIAEYLAEEKVENLGVLCHQEERDQFGFGAFLGSKLDGSGFDLNGEWRADPLYATAVKEDGVFPLREFAGRSPLANLLHKEFNGIVSFAVRAGPTQGIVFVPLRTEVAKRQRKSFEPPPGCSFGTVTLFHGYSRLIGNAVETQDSNARSKGALDALGLIGHELSAPLAIANSDAEKGLNAAKKFVDALSRGEAVNRAGEKIERNRENMWKSQEAVRITLELARLIAQDSNDELQFHFENRSIYEILHQAVEEVRVELELERHRRRFHFNFAPSSKRLGSVTCDPFYLAHVFKNLIRNAVKYSLPRDAGEPMVVDLIGEGQERFVAVKVRNWGLGIPEDRRDMIFQPWVRGGLEDRKKAIRGMGLGLYLAQRIISAHKGSIRFTSEPTLDDRRRIKLLEGFETVFEVRIPRDLPKGTYTYSPTARAFVGNPG